MGKKLNCWEFRRCGREPGGMWAAYRGVCPAAVESELDGTNGGVNGGRACWEVAGTPGTCSGERVVSKLDRCACCSFFLEVTRDRQKSGDSQS